MHLLNSARTRLTCVPVVHEVAAGISAEYFNQVSSNQKAFALVTAGPGLTNIMTAMAGAWLEHRELLVVGGQVKSTDLRSEGLRQRGIQEIDGIALAQSVCKSTLQIRSPQNKDAVVDAVRCGFTGRPGPVFIEFCLDAQGGVPVSIEGRTSQARASSERDFADRKDYEEACLLINSAKRPAILIGAGVSRSAGRHLATKLAHTNIPVFTTWHAADRISKSFPNYFGRPETWGQRSANLLINQADVILVVGARLGLQETGFNWQLFCPTAKIIHVDIDKHELEKGHPNTQIKIQGDADTLLRYFVDRIQSTSQQWLEYCAEVRNLIPLNDPSNTTADGFVSPYVFYEDLSEFADESDIWVPASSGGANSVAIQALSIAEGQICICNNGLASMGYGLPGAIGAAFAEPNRRVMLVEGDGSISQNIQELATISVNSLNIKIFIFDNEGYGSIRTTQRNYFGGAYLGCDTATGLGFPDWQQLASAYRIDYLDFSHQGFSDQKLVNALGRHGPLICVVPIDPQQTYWPKISSRIGSNGRMESDPLYEMTPRLSPEERAITGRFIQ